MTTPATRSIGEWNSKSSVAEQPQRDLQRLHVASTYQVVAMYFTACPAQAKTFMLIIRAEQLAALGAARRLAFESAMTEHLEQTFPDWASSLGDERLRSFVRHGIARAREHGLRSEMDIGRYLHVMQVLGERFDESSEYPWALPLLASELPPEQKIDRLRDAMDYELEVRRINHVR